MRPYRTCKKGPAKLIKFEESVDRWVREQATAEGKSVVQFIEDCVKGAMPPVEPPQQANITP